MHGEFSQRREDLPSETGEMFSACLPSHQAWEKEKVHSSFLLPFLPFQREVGEVGKLPGRLFSRQRKVCGGRWA